MREGRRVDERPVGAPSQPLDRVDQLTLVVRLRPAALDAERAGPLAGRRLDFRQGGATVDLRFALSQQIEVGAVQHGDVH